jgi:glucokinase
LEKLSTLNHSVAVGADIGGSHITTALIDLENRTLIAGSYYRTHIDANGSAVDIICNWAEVIKKSMAAATGTYKIGIAMPGPFDYEKGISFITGLHKYESLYRLNVKNLLAAELQIEVQHIKMANDASCFLRGELFSGAVKGELNVTGLTLGTGFGSAIAENGIVRDGAYFDLPFLDAKAEDYFCSRWLVKRYHEISGRQVANVKEIALLSDIHTATVFHEFGANLALFLSTLDKVPERVLLGGNIAQTYHLFNPGLQEGLNKKGLNISFVLSMLDENAALLGAVNI